MDKRIRGKDFDFVGKSIYIVYIIYIYWEANIYCHKYINLQYNITVILTYNIVS